MASFYTRITYFPLVCLLLLGLISCGVVDDAGEGVNDPPSVVGGADQTVDEQTMVILTSSVTDDFEGIESSDWQQIDGPAVVLQNADSTEARFIAPQVLVQNSPLILEFRFTVKDNFGASASATVKVAVRAVNISPVAAGDSDNVDEGSMVTLNVTDNDADQDGQIVFDSIEIFSVPASGVVDVNDDGTITYTHNGAEILADGFTYTIRDNETTVSDPATVSITVNPINDPPEAQAGSLVLNEDATNAGGTLSATDPDSTVMFSRVSNATHGSATVNGNGSYTYRPDPNFSGSDSFTFGVTDEEFASMAQVTITVNPVNDTPRFTSSAPKTAKVGELYTYNIVAVDVEGDGLSITATALPSWLKISDKGGGKATLSGTPGVGDVGNNNVLLVVKDNGSPSKTSSQSFTIAIAANDPPKFTSTAPKTAMEGEPYIYSIVATDPDGDALSITAPTRPGWLSFIDNGGGKATLSGTPDEGDVGSHAVTLQVKDDGTPATTILQSFTIVVTKANDPPRFTSTAPKTAMEGGLYTYNIVATDPDGDALSITAPTRPGWLSFTDNGGGKATLTGTPDEGDVGSHDVKLQVKDDGSPALTTDQSFTIVVTEVNDAPVITGQAPNPLVTPESTPLTIKLANLIISDPDDDNFTLAVQGGTNYTVSGATITPASGFSGSLSVPVTVNDGDATSNVFPLIVSVTVVNGPPSFTSTPTTTATVVAPYEYKITATDPDGDTLTITAPTLPAWLGLVPAGNGAATLVGIPLAGNVGTHDVVLSVTDGASTPVTQSFSIVVSTAPTQAESLNGNQSRCWTTPRQQPLVGSLSDPQVSSSALYSLVGSAGMGTITITDVQTGAFNYVPHPQGERGVDEFTYRVDDPRGEVTIKSATVIIHARLMLLGDSITAGLSDAANGLPAQELRIGYRKPLYDALLAENYPIELVGSQRSGTAIPGFDADHEGHSGWTADEIAYGRNLEETDGVYQWLENNPADIVLLHIGTHGLTTSPAGVAAILDEIGRWERSANGNHVTVILARIIDQSPSNLDVREFNENLQTLAQDRVNNSEHAAYPDDIIVVDQASALSYPADLYDTLHPNAMGYVKMARPWYDALTDSTLDILDRCP